MKFTNLDAFKSEGLAMLDLAFSKGVSYFDTAPGYGIAETMLTQWLQQQPGKNIELATKWGYTYTANFNPKATVHEVKEHSLSKLEEQWQTSKQLLPHLSTYQIHSATFESGVLENQEVLQQLLELKTKHQLWVGLTTTGANQLEVLNAALNIQVLGRPLFDVFQVTYNVLDQSLKEILTQISASGKRVIIKEAMANGRVLAFAQIPQYQNMYQYLAQLADKYGVTADAIALRFCIDSIRPYVVLSGASTSIQLDQNLSALNFELTTEEIAELTHFSIRPQDYWLERKQLRWS